VLAVRKDEKLMRIRIAAVVFGTMCTGQMALAGGIDVPPNFYDWSGVYVGANAGYAGGSVTDSITGTQSFTGAIAGGQIGANLQYRSLLFGAEVDGDWSGQQGSNSSLSFNTRWLATARIRVGWAYDNIAYYATGGAGYVHFSSNAPDGTAFTATHTAWVAGLGQESTINRNLLLRFEVLYLSFLGNATTPPGVIGVSSSQSMYDIMFRIGLNYKFDWLGK
jgi:outer membrane immunogenic protein